MGNVVLHGHTFRVKISASEIQKAVGDVARQINTDLKGKKPLFLAVLTRLLYVCCRPPEKGEY
jgi:hypoxanthine-guanine phosphoribosyltransferase